jgi:hypothetical protein
VVGQAKNCSPVHLLARFRTRPHEMFPLAQRPPGDAFNSDPPDLATTHH